MLDETPRIGMVAVLTSRSMLNHVDHTLIFGLCNFDGAYKEDVMAVF